MPCLLLRGRRASRFLKIFCTVSHILISLDSYNGLVRLRLYFFIVLNLLHYMKQDGNASKSSQKLRLPKTKLGSGCSDQDRASDVSEGITSIGTSVPQVQSRRHAGLRQKSEHNSRARIRVPTAPLQLRWFLGNQVT